jgi:hypothetical protein
LGKYRYGKAPVRTLMDLIRVEGFNTPPFRALKKGIKPRIQIPYENNMPRPFRARLLIRCEGSIFKNLISRGSLGAVNKLRIRPLKKGVGAAEATAGRSPRRPERGGAASKTAF